MDDTIMAKTLRRFYKSVSANTSEVDEFTPPSGTYYLSELGGNAGLSPDTVVTIIWDYGGSEEILYCIHGSGEQNVEIELDADGTKTLAIKLINDQSTDDFLGGFWTGSD